MDGGQDQTPSSALNRLARLLRSGALFIAIGYVGLYLSVALLRVSYPFDLEWMEGSSVEHVRRLLTGRPLYVAPSLEFIPHNYPPLYFYVSAAVAQVLGVTPTSLRLVSIVSSLASFVAIYLLVKRETGNRYAAGLAAGLFAATFRIAGAFFDIARVDSLFLALFLAGVYLIRAHTKHSMLVCAGLLFSLAILTKQTALVMTGPVILYLAMTDVRRALILLGVLGLVAGGGTLALDYLSNGWYTYYVFELPTQFAARLVRSRLVFFWTDDILSPLTIACGLAAIGLASMLSTAKSRGGFYLVVTAGMLLGAWLPRLQSGGYNNTLMPAFAGISILFGIGVHEIMQYAQRWSPQERVVVGIGVYSFCILQFAGLLYNPITQIPTRRDENAGRALVEKLAQIPGRIFMPYHSGCYVAELMERCGSAHQMSISDIRQFGSDEARTMLADDYGRAIAEKRFDVILLDGGDRTFLAAIEKHYVRQELDLGGANVLWPLTGFRTRPQLMFVPRTTYAVPAARMSAQPR
jgi:4-amino-4-deoxy-L-arabinose transferase-like glycosyltransferase